MKDLTRIKIYVSSYFRNLSRERIAIFICIPISLVALLICAIMLLSLDKKAMQKPNVNNAVTEAATEKITYSPENPYSLEYESLGNGCCAIVGIGSFNGKDLKIPQTNSRGETVTEIAPKAFSDCNTLESVFIPSTVEEIGNKAFRGCRSLIYIDVDMNNKSFTSISGVLFSKNRSRLIYYPAKRVGERYYLNANVRAIDDHAFADAEDISVILYPNSTADFEAISIGKGNDILHTLPITCNYTGSK